MEEWPLQILECNYQQFAQNWEFLKYFHFIVFKEEICFISHQQYFKQLLTQILWKYTWKRLFYIDLEIIDFCQVTWRLLIKFDLLVCLQMFFIIMKGEHKFNMHNILFILYQVGLFRNWYLASRLGGYQFLKSPAWYKINYMFFILNSSLPFIIIKNICRHTNIYDLIDICQVTWRKSIISKFIWNNLFHVYVHKICVKSSFKYCLWIMKIIFTWKTMKWKYFRNSQFGANC